MSNFTLSSHVLYDCLRQPNSIYRRTMLPIFRRLNGYIPSIAQSIVNIINALHRPLPIYLCLSTTTPFEILVGQSNFQSLDM